MSQPLRFPALSAPQVWVPRKTFLPALFSAGIVKDHFKRGSVAERQLPDSFFESPESDVVGDSARRSGAFEPVVHVNIGDMPVRIEMQNTGDPRTRGDIVARIEHVLSDRAGEWRVSIVGSRANDNWEMKVEGPAGFERSYTLVGGAGEHEPAAIGNLVVKLLPARKNLR